MRQTLEQYRVVLGVALVGLAVGAGLALFLYRPSPQQPLRVVAPAATAPPTELVVHVSGEVLVPGVYRVATGSRIEDGITAAGGVTAEADPHALNLAARLVDGQKISVPARSQARSASSDQRTSGSQVKINLNTADQTLLDTLPGVGTVTARRILEYRAQVGRFERVEELREARLVTAPTFERIKELVTVD